ncbi:hypothetical protein NDS46_29110 [Paenibacillus thiaminolyticus]|uniref:hypothetical protein n=1 Tax=Paenibacillus thiaminolyticus TaxID=49283 RepID=UPI00232EC2A5|nr:hypothetical protein [Paenibacillus thiaminolyticus]WCF08265.1 hypothetical protein NDS46_29110 [Paenibacillus thiaminolyticus]
MRILMITIVYLCLVLAGCARDNEGAKAKPEHAPVAEGQEKSATLRDTSDASDNSGEAHVEDEPRIKEAKVEDLGPFQRGVFFDEMTYEKKYEEIAALFRDNINAWAAKDKTKFRKGFMTKATADYCMFLLENKADYEFVGTPAIIEQLDWIDIHFSYRTSEAPDKVVEYVTTFKKDLTEDKKDIWKITLIDYPEPAPKKGEAADLVFLDESKYEGMQKEMIKLVNLYAKYTNERDEENFKRLFHPRRNYELPTMEILKMEVGEFKVIKETEGSVSIIMTKKSLKEKQVDEDMLSWYHILPNKAGEWKIIDID